MKYSDAVTRQLSQIMYFNRNVAPVPEFVLFTVILFKSSFFWSAAEMLAEAVLCRIISQ